MNENINVNYAAIANDAEIKRCIISEAGMVSARFRCGLLMSATKPLEPFQFDVPQLLNPSTVLMLSNQN